MKILHLDKNHPLLVSQLAAAGHSNDENYTISKQETEAIIKDYDGIVIRSRFKVDKQFLDAATNLKFIARVGAGLESIDIPYATEKGIHLISAPEGNRNAVGEHALGMLLSLFNKLNRADQSVKSGNWLREAHRGVELEGKTVGLIGYGNMGKAFAKKLQGFDCEVLCYDILDNVGDKNARQVSLEALQAKADVLSLHTPWTPLTDKMVDENFIAAFAKAFYIINTARGKSVVTADLVQGLKSAKILGAGLDVLEYEKASFESLFARGTPQAERSPTLQAERTPTPQAENIPTPQAERIPTPQAERIPTPHPDRSRTPHPDRTPTLQAERSRTPQAERTPTPHPDRNPTLQAERTPTPQAEHTPTLQAERTPTPQAEHIPTPHPDRNPTPQAERSRSLPEALQYLLKADNVLLTPHIAGWTIESKRKLAQTIVAKILVIF